MGKIPVFVCSITNFIPKCPVVAIMGLFFPPIPSNDPNKTYINESNHFPTTSRGTFSIWGVALPSAGPRRTFSEFGDILALEVGTNFQPPLDGWRRCPEVAGLSPLLKDTKKNFENPNVLWFSLFLDPELSPITRIVDSKSPFFWTYKRILRVLTFNF